MWREAQEYNAALRENPDRFLMTEEEKQHIKEHPVIAAQEILKPISYIQDILPIIEHHHENWDGTGYPNKISKDEIFFHHGGGVTLSGGEVLAQPHFAYEILVQCHELGIDTTVETSCFAKWTTIEPMLRFLNHMYIDVKIMDDKVHRSYVGVSNKLILENIMKIDAMSNTAFTLRVPFIPGVNDNMNNFEQLCEFVMPLKNIRAVEVLPYHRLGVETYKNLGLENPFADCLPPSRNSMERVVRPLNRLRGLPVRIL